MCIFECLRAGLGEKNGVCYFSDQYIQPILIRDIFRPIANSSKKNLQFMKNRMMMMMMMMPVANVFQKITFNTSNMIKITMGYFI
jgi:hypothetical protein